MSREIKFRWWNGQQVSEANNMGMLAKNLSNLSHLMRYTGLNDRNGVEIYAGDIVRTYLRKGEVEMQGAVEWDSEGYWSWCGYFYLEAALNWGDGCEVIGNIYEHPHLLEEIANG